MTESQDHEDLVRRLHRLGEQPVDPALASAHLTAMAAQVAPERRRFGRLAVAGAAMAGFLFGGLGLGWADALPGPAQGVADKVLERVGPDGPWNRGQCISEAARTHKGDTATAQQERADAKAQCPKGGKPEGVGSQGQGKPDRVKPHADDPCKGGPPWAGEGRGPTPAEQAAFDAQRAGCPADVEDAGQPEVEGAEEPEVEAESSAEVQTQTEATTPTTQATTNTTESTTTTTTAVEEPETTGTSAETEDSTDTTGTTDTTDTTDTTGTAGTTATTGTSDTTEPGA